MYPRKEFFAGVLYLFLVYCFHNVRSTEVTTGPNMTRTYHDLQINLPVFTCHAIHTGYKEVIWYKDHKILRKGSSALSSHFLSLSSLLDSNATWPAFENPLQLQGYYWCETDLSGSSNSIHAYLFRIDEIHTFVGRLLATNDSLGDGILTSDKLSLKMKIYENEMQSILFGTMPNLEVSVTNIKVIKDGLDVHFFLYVRDLLHRRTPFDDKLKLDENHLLDIQEYLANETSSFDSDMYNISADWLDLLGINIQNIELKSTLGCYEEAYPMSSNATEEVIWPYARIGDVVIPYNTCSSKNGLAITRMCTGSFTGGAKWGNPSGKCEKSADGITLKLKDLYNKYGRDLKPLYITKLTTLVEYPSDLGVTDLHIIAEILKELSLSTDLGQQEISGILSVVDKMMETNKTELVAAKNTIRLTSRVLRIFDNILESASIKKKEIRFSKQHLMVDTKYTKTADSKNPVLGLAVIAPNNQDSLYNGSVEFLLSNAKLPKQNSIAYFSLPRELVLKRETELDKVDFPCQVNMVFFKQWDLFQNPKGVLVKRNYKVLPTPVMYITLSGGPAWNLTDPVELYFKDTFEEKIENPVCVYYDPRQADGAGAWISEGCEYGGLKDGYYHCRCHHLSIFAVVLSRNPKADAKLKLGTSVYVGCGVSILALSLAVLLYVLSKNWRQTVDHSILFCLSLTFLCCLIIIFISEIHFKMGWSCIVLAMIFHYTLFAIFGWLLVQAVVYRLRFAKKTDVSEIPHFIIKAALSVWGLPIIIVFIMWLSKEYSCSVKDGCWITVAEVSKVAAIPLVVLMLITLCINVCATVALTCHFRKDFLIGDSGYNDVALKYRVAFTIFFFFVLSWLFGFCALHNGSKTLRILFSISITLTAYYVTLFFIFQEISFWDLCSRCRKKEEPESSAIEYTAKSYKSVDDPNIAEK